MRSEKFMFPNAKGEQLAATLDWPLGKPTAFALFAHCFTCSKDIPAARRIAARLAAMGLAVLRFAFTGLGHSEGEFENTDFTSTVGDLVAAAQYLSGRGMAPGLLIGHSLGGAAVLMAAADIPSAKAVVTLGAPADPGHVIENFDDALPRIKAQGVAEVNLGGRPFRIAQSFIEDVSQARLLPAIHGLKRALLVMHAPRDTVVGIENATQIFMAAQHPKSFVTLDDADHLISRPADAEYAAQVIATWAARYLDLRPPAPPPGAPEGIVRVSEADADGFLQDVTSGQNHHLLADEPLAYGGTDRGLSPYGLVAAGLGACTSMTIRMYARRKGWPLDHVRVDVSHNKVHAQDAGTKSEEKIDEFIRAVHLSGDLDPEQRARLMQIAERCPVHRTLERSAVVVTRMVETP